MNEGIRQASLVIGVTCLLCSFSWAQPATNPTTKNAEVYEFSPLEVFRPASIKSGDEYWDLLAGSVSKARIVNVAFPLLLDASSDKEARPLRFTLDSSTSVFGNVEAQRLKTTPQKRSFSIKGKLDENKGEFDLYVNEFLTREGDQITKQQILVGNFDLNNGWIYSVRYVGKGHHAVLGVRKSDLLYRDCASDQIAKAPLPVQPFAARKTATTTTATVRIAIVYTDEVLDVHGNLPASIETVADFCIIQTNRALNDSETLTEVELGHFGPASGYDENDKDYPQILVELKDGVVDSDLPNRRRDNECDLVCLLVSKPCVLVSGIAYTLDKSNNTPGDFAPLAFSVVEHFASTLTLKYTFAHEIGHLFGCEDWCTATSGCSGAPNCHSCPDSHRLHPYVYGHQLFTDGPCSVMAYGKRILHYSNPSVEIDGNDTGVEHESDNAKVIRTERGLVKSLSDEL
ncbi:MAG: M12 family metallo-peptidase [Planctomycetota bacterium]